MKVPLNRIEKVSILTPCFNSGRFLNRLLDSILDQTYPNIEMLIVNDGSSDNSEEIIISYIQKFSEKKYTLDYINQTNQGQGVAINNGLKHISGEFLIWPDSDDFFASSEAIEKMADTLRNDPEASVVRCFSNILDEESLRIIGTAGRNLRDHININQTFEECLFNKNDFWFGAGNYMVRKKALVRYYPELDIYSSNKYGGQNWQLLLPALYNSKCVTLTESLHNIVARKNSHSRNISKNISSEILRLSEHEKILLKTINVIRDMPHTENDSYCRAIKKKYGKQKIQMYLKAGDKLMAKTELSNLSLKINLNKKENYIIRLNFLPFSSEIKTIAQKIWHILRLY